MSDKLKNQVDLLQKSIAITDNMYDKLIMMDALRSAWLLLKDVDKAEQTARDFNSQATIFVKSKSTDTAQKSKILDKMFDAYVTLAPNDFHSFLIALEWERPVMERFYQLRMSVLRSVADNFTDMMVHDKYDMIMLSMPPGTGKSTLGLFFLMWVIGRKPEKCNLAIGYSTPIAKSFFSRIGSIDMGYEYTYHKIFPDLTRIYTSARELEYDFSNDAASVKKPFPSIMFSSIEGSLTGRGRCEGVLYCDDLVEGAETAMSAARLEKLWTLYNDNARSRKKENCKELHIGTRWSLNDPIGRLMAIYSENSRVKIISLPALNDDDESNFDYGYGVGFSTATYHDFRLTQSTISWNALYMQKPIEAEGLLFPVDSLHRYKLEDLNYKREPFDDVFAFCDVAFGGADALSMPIMGQWGSDAPYVLDVVFMRGSYEKTQPKIIGKLAQWGVNRVVFEANNGGDFYAEDIKNLLKDNGIACFVSTQRAGTRISKESRIIQHSPAIKTFRFRKSDDYPTDGMYREFMQNLITYTAEGNNDHDDAPDSCAGVASIMRSNIQAKVKTFFRHYM